MNSKKLLLLFIILLILLAACNVYFINKNMKYEAYISLKIRENLSGVGNTLERCLEIIERDVSTDEEISESTVNSLNRQFLDIQIFLKELEEIRLKLDIAMEKQHPGSVDAIELFNVLFNIFLYKADNDKLDDEKFLLAVSELISEFYGLFDDVPLKTSNDPYKYYESYWNNMLKKDDWLILIGKMNELAHKNQEIVR